MSNVLIKVDLSLGVRLLNLLSLDKMPLPFFIFSRACPEIPVTCNFRPKSLPSLHVFMFLPFIVSCCVLYCAIGIILNFSSLVLIFHCLSYLLIRSISLSAFNFIIFLDLDGVVITWVMSSAYIMSKQPCPATGKSFVYSVYIS